MENLDSTQKPHKHEEGGAKKPPGEFVNDELEAHTKRFLDEVKGRAKRRREASEESAGPPPPSGDQRSSRR